ncbi:hypothetical protein X975_26550, partial [Stegodyphus mimosarum]
MRSSLNPNGRFRFGRRRRNSQDEQWSSFKRCTYFDERNDVWILQ